MEEETQIGWDSDGIIVAVRTDPGTVAFRFGEPTYVRKDIECVLATTVKSPGTKDRIFQARLNINSMSGRESYVRQLGRAFGGEEYNWTMLLSDACSRFIVAYGEAQMNELKWADGIEIEPTSFLVEPFVEDKAANILFGKGGTGKTWLAIRLMMSLASGADFLGRKATKLGKSIFIDYENSESVFSRRVQQLAPFVPGFKPEHERMLAYYNPKGMPMSEIVKSIGEMVRKNEISLAVIDSAALACGAAPEDAVNAIKFFNAVNGLGIASLTIGHQSKASNGDYIFGSVFFTNSARNIWNLKAEQEQDEDVVHAGLFHRKCNNSRLSSPQGVRIYFTPEGLVDINAESLAVSVKEMPIKQRIRNSLRESAKTTDMLKEDLGNVSKDVLKVRLSEMRSKGHIENMAGFWKLKDEEIRSLMSEKLGQ